MKIKKNTSKSWFKNLACVGFLVLPTILLAQSSIPYENTSGLSNLSGQFRGQYIRNANIFVFFEEDFPSLIVTYGVNEDPGSGPDRDSEIFKQNLAENGDHPAFFSSPNPCFGSDGPPPEYSTGAIFADFDNDGDRDFYSPNPDYHGLYRFNSDSGEYENVTNLIDEGNRSEYWETVTASWGDFDGDGFVDLFVTFGNPDHSSRTDGVRLYRNVGGTSFEATVEQNYAGINEQLKDILTPIWADFDQDHDVDLLLVQSFDDDLSASRYYDNRIHETEGYMISDPDIIYHGADHFDNKNTIAVCTDFNYDGVLDLAYHHRQGLGVISFQSDGSGFQDYWIDNNRYTGNDPLPRIHDLAAFDADHDGDVDLLCTTREMDAYDPYLYISSDDHSTLLDAFQSFPNGTEDLNAYWGLAVADFTLDGLQEFFLGRGLESGSTESGNFFYDLDNATYGNTNWVGFELEALGGLCNRDCLGATVIVRSTDGGTQFIQAQVVDGGSGRSSQSSPRLNFGLGSYSGNVDVEVQLPNRGVIPGGSTFTFSNLAPGQYHGLQFSEFTENDVTINLEHDASLGYVKMIVNWTTDYPTVWEEDAVVFHDGNDAIVPSQMIHNVTVDPNYGPTGPYHHKVVITGLPCDASKRYYINIQGQASGSEMTINGPVLSAQTKLCLSPGPDLPDNPVWP